MPDVRWRCWIAEVFAVEIENRNDRPVFYLDLAKLVQLALPMRVLRKIFGYAFRNEDVPGIRAIHDAPGNVNAATGDVRAVIDVADGVDWAAVDTHPQMNVRMTAQCFADFERALHR